MSEEIMKPIANAVIDEIVPYKEIAAALIVSATSIRNTDCVTRAMYAQIEARLTECREYIAANMDQFNRKMAAKEYALSTYRYVLDSLQKRLSTASGDDLFFCTKCIESVIKDMTQFGVSNIDPDIIQPPYI